ncbi:DeoR/GlpR transcriptional regulator [Corynebacterium incognita]|uniref:DeoR/GlpR transcriptional regulator n=1 Tax=Corynebacterium incognita TaxID=2754725 RepID=A0A7G7CQI2_9CORY|nr:DeoR/GlpR transcriptional regulator [Corynebacterium incognita]
MGRYINLDVKKQGCRVSEEPATQLRPAQRRTEILSLVQYHDRVSIDDLVQRFGVSVMTIHRDLEALDKAGKLVKIRGGARRVATDIVERDVTLRRATNTHVKEALAQVVVKLIEPGSIIALDDSTTVATLLPLVMDTEPAGIITHSLDLMRTIGEQYPSVSLTGIGGRYVSATDSFLGASTNAAMANLSATYSIVSTTCIARDGLYHPDEDAASTKRALCGVGAHKILVSDSSKFDNLGMHFVAGLAEFRDIVVDSNLSAEQRDMLEYSGATVHLVDTPPPTPTAPSASKLL